ncbi:hypothetical protein [Paenibacillus kobensis]|uniref:hypothetical protein n=1 Tax=Paenibacillus kobensis TaxID=59841 RepID=UPI000FDBCEEC|nr:hypothetical protein [Paenibacillus kobensis]
MHHVKIGKLLIVNDCGVICIYSRHGSDISSYYFYGNGITHHEVYRHDDELECFGNWLGLLESFELQEGIA